MSKQTEIERALFSHFALLNYAIVDTPNGPVLNPGADDTWFRLDCLMGNGYASALGSEALNRYTGIFQVTITAPADHLGDAAVNEVAEAIAAHFKRGTVCSFDTTQVRCRVPVIVPSPEQAKESTYVKYVRVPWYAYIDE